MAILFEVFKWIFFFLTLLVGVFFLRGEVIVGFDYYVIIKQIIMPGYLLFCGIMVSYIVAHIWLGNNGDTVDSSKIFVKAFLIGIGFGLVLGLTYIFI